MAEFGNENNVDGVFGGVSFGEENSTSNTNNETNFNISGTQTENAQGVNGEKPVFTKVEAGNLPTKPSIWSKIKSFLFQEIDLNAPIKVELTPYQQKVEKEINDFLHQEVSFKGFFNLFKGNKQAQ